jgi:TPR repeat protein
MFRYIRLILTIVLFGSTMIAGAATADHAGDMYSKGNTYWHEKDYKQALKWYARAANNGHLPAIYKVALMHDRGLGTKLNTRMAFRWYKKAAVMKYHPAQYQLGHIYAKGRGVKRDTIKAYMWYNLAASSGNKIAADYRDNLARQMDNRQIIKAHKLIDKWMEKR